jgi:hypothetical protein
MIWRPTASTGPLSIPAEVVLLLEMNDAAEAIVLPGYARARCFELYRAFAPAESATPRYCVLHESDSAKAPSTARDDGRTVWRLPYRRMART